MSVNHKNELTQNSLRPKVSIVVPVYNGEKFVSSTIDSLLEQTYENIEIIAVDDGSQDKSFDILQKYKDKIKIFSHSNHGQSYSLNFGWNQASGDILGYLSADDRLLPYALDHLVQALNNDQNLVGVYPDFYLINEKGTRTKEVKSPEFNKFNLVARGICQPGPGALFKKSFYKKTNGWKTNLKQLPDYEFWLNITKYGDLKRYPSLLAEFRVHNESQSYSISTVEKSEEPIQVIKNFFSKKNQSLPFFYKNISLAHAYILSARLHIKSKRLKTGTYYLLKAILNFPLIIFDPLALKRTLNGILFYLKFK